MATATCEYGDLRKQASCKRQSSTNSTGEGTLCSARKQSTRIHDRRSQFQRFGKGQLIRHVRAIPFQFRCDIVRLPADRNDVDWMKAGVTPCKHPKRFVLTPPEFTVSSGPKVSLDRVGSQCTNAVP